MNSTPLGPVASNSLGNCLHVGQINQMNGVPNPAITMQSQMVMQLGQSNINSNNGWSGMLTQNLQPAPGSNPFFNLTSQQQQQSIAFGSQLPQQMAQLSLGATSFQVRQENPLLLHFPDKRFPPICGSKSFMNIIS